MRRTGYVRDKKQRLASVKHYYKSDENGAEARRKLARQFGIPFPQGRNITSLVKKFEETGSGQTVCRAVTDRLRQCLKYSISSLNI